MCRYIYIALALATSVAFGPTAQAATLKATTNKDGRVIISLTGEIAPGDNETLRSLIKAANDAGKLANSIRLESAGGNLVEGVKLSETVRYGKIAANVAMNATCASACFLVFAVGTAKYANYTARIGVHGASGVDGSETTVSGAATVSMARVAKNLGVPPAIIGRMVVTQPAEMVWLSPTDLQSMGAVMVGKPDQISSEANLPPTSQLPPISNSIASNTKATASKEEMWKDLVKTAAQESAKLYGKPMFVRTCQPELKSCSEAIFYKNEKGVELMVRQTKDLNDRITRRDFCNINADGDIRRCLDWDAGQVTREVKNSSKQWIYVADD